VVGDRILILFAEAEPDVGPAPLTVQFSVWDPYDTTEDPKFYWDFGDGSPISRERRPAHVYEKPGAYTVRFYASDTQNLVDDDEIEIEVEEP
jgi:PKD repeat protein